MPSSRKTASRYAVVSRPPTRTWREDVWTTCDERSGLSTGDGRRLPFAEYNDAGVRVGGAAKHWFDFDAAGLEPSTRDRYLENIRNLAAFFRGKTIRAITLKLAEQWVVSRPPKMCAASTFNKELEILKRILKYAHLHHCVESAQSHVEGKKLHDMLVVLERYVE